MTYATHLNAVMKPTQFCYQSASLYNSMYHKWSSVLFTTRLVSRGGTHVDMPPPPPIDASALSEIMDKGTFYAGEIATTIDDSTSDQISDLLESVMDDPSTFHLYAGYALFADGVWRFHDWIYNSEDDMILDSIPSKTLYYGAVVASGTDESARAVAASLINLDDEEI